MDPAPKADRSKLLRATVRPGAGRKLPKALRAADVSVLAEALPLGVCDTGFEELVQRIDTGPIHAGNQVEIFSDGEDAFAAVKQAMDNAREEILLETYILKDDATGKRILSWIGAAAKRGVRTRVLADAFGSWGTKRAFWREMQGRGIEARPYRPFSFPFRGVFFRDHRKIIVIDRQVAFTGGMNVANEYGASRRNHDVAWRDTQMRIQGTTAWEMALVFNEGWERAGGASLLVTKNEPATNSGAKAIVLDCRPGRGHGETAAVLAALAGAARSRIWITNAYFAPNPITIRLLVRAAHRGVDVRLLLPGRTDMPLIRHAGHGNFSKLLAAGVRIFEYQSAVLHAKTLVADDYASVVGSSNFDYRSFYFNAECNVLMFDETAADKLSRAFEEDLSNSKEITPEAWKQRSWLHKSMDFLATLLSPLL